MDAQENKKGLSRKEASDYLRNKYGTPGRVSLATLTRLASVGGGPVFTKIGKYACYDTDDLDAWQKSRMESPVMKQVTSSPNATQGN